VAKAWASLPSCEQQAATNARRGLIRQKQRAKREAAAAGAPAMTSTPAGTTNSAAAAAGPGNSPQAAAAAAGGDVSDHDDDSDVEVVCEVDLGSALAARRAAAVRAGLCIDLTSEADPAEVVAAGAWIAWPLAVAGVG
jgi:hypothetical protein